jgi:hypothetical protein
VFDDLSVLADPEDVHDRLTPHLATRLGSPAAGAGHDLCPAAFAAAALACLNVANAAWVAGDGNRPLGLLIDEAMRAVHPAGF